jgi:hypothetical protein
VKYPPEIEAALDNPDVGSDEELLLMRRYFHEHFTAELVQGERWVSWLRRNKITLVEAQKKGLFK